MANRTGTTGNVASTLGGGECTPTTGLDEPGDLRHVVPVAAGEQPRVVEGRGVAGLRGRAADRQRDDATPRDRAQEAQAARAVLQGADLRAGATLPSAALPQRARARAPGLHHSPHADPGEDLVPESQVQDEEGGERARRGRRQRLLAQKSRRAGAGERRQALPVQADGAHCLSRKRTGPHGAVHAEILVVR